jgi:hypothetical protein
MTLKGFLKLLSPNKIMVHVFLLQDERFEGGGDNEGIEVKQGLVDSHSDEFTSHNDLHTLSSFTTSLRGKEIQGTILDYVRH